MPRTATLPPLALALSLSTGTALAQVPDPVSDARIVASALGLRDVTFEGVTTGGSAIVVRGVRGKVVGTTDGKPGSGVGVRVANARIEGARREGEGHAYAQVSLDGIEIGAVRVDRVVVGALVSPGGNGRSRFDVLQGRGVGYKTEEGEVLAAEGFHLANAGWKGNVALHSTLQVRGMTATAGRTSLATAIAPDLPRSADLDLTWDYAPQTRQGRIHDGTLWLGKAALLRLDATLDGVGPVEGVPDAVAATPPAQASEPGLPLLGALEGVRLAGATLRLENAGLVQTLMKARMLIEGGTPEKAASETARQAELLYPKPAGDAGVRTQLLSGLRAFLSDPRSLTVRISPPEGENDLARVGLGIWKGVATQKSLGLTVKANGADPIQRAAR